MTDTVRIMSSNVLHADDPSSLSAKFDYRQRAKLLADTYLTYMPDFLGLQEIKSYMLEPILAPLEDEYALVPVKTDGKNNHTPILYRKKLYRLIESKFYTFFEVGCWHYEWALYEKMDSKKRYIHMNLHYHFSDTETRLPEAQLVNAELKRLTALYPDAPIFVTGDYNCEADTPEFAAMIEGLEMNSGMLLTDDNDGYDVGWHPIGSENYVGRGAIDHVCVTHDRAKVLRHRKIKSAELVFATDHDPIFVDVSA